MVTNILKCHFRQPNLEQGTGNSLDEEDFGRTVDGLTDDALTDDVVSDDHVDSDLKRQLQFDGMFLDPEKYDPVRMLGSGGFGQVKVARGNVQYQDGWIVANTYRKEGFCDTSLQLRVTERPTFLFVSA